MLTGLLAGFSSSSPESEPFHEHAQGVVCLANISPKERRKRLNFAIVQMVIGVVALAFLLLFGAEKLWRLPLFFMFAASATSYYQWRDKT